MVHVNRISNGNGGLVLDTTNTLPPIVEDVPAEAAPQGEDPEAPEPPGGDKEPQPDLGVKLSEETDKLLKDIDVVLGGMNLL